MVPPPSHGGIAAPLCEAIGMRRVRVRHLSGRSLSPLAERFVAMLQALAPAHDHAGH